MSVVAGFFFMFHMRVFFPACEVFFRMRLFFPTCNSIFSHAKTETHMWVFNITCESTKNVFFVLKCQQCVFHMRVLKVACGKKNPHAKK